MAEESRGECGSCSNAARFSSTRWPSSNVNSETSQVDNFQCMPNTPCNKVFSCTQVMKRG